MKEFWNTLQLVFAAVGGWLGYFLGGCDGLLYALLIFVVCDYITGVMGDVSNDPRAVSAICAWLALGSHPARCGCGNLYGHLQFYRSNQYRRNSLRCFFLCGGHSLDISCGVISRYDDFTCGQYGSCFKDIFSS